MESRPVDISSCMQSQEISERKLKASIKWDTAFKSDCNHIGEGCSFEGLLKFRTIHNIIADSFAAMQHMAVRQALCITKQLTACEILLQRLPSLKCICRVAYHEVDPLWTHKHFSCETQKMQCQSSVIIFFATAGSRCKGQQPEVSAASQYPFHFSKSWKPVYIYKIVLGETWAKTS